jgi:hypothetical protein
MNSDGRIDIADGIFLLSFLFQEDDAPLCMEAADANNDTRVDVADSIYSLMYLFQNGAEPASPFPGCGVDPDPDTTVTAFVGGSVGHLPITMSFRADPDARRGSSCPVPEARPRHDRYSRGPRDIGACMWRWVVSLPRWPGR